MRLLLLCAWVACAQRTTTHALQVTAGAMRCSFERREPAALSGLHLECVSPTSSVKTDAVIAVGSSGQSGSFYAGPDAILWTFQRPVDGPLLYKVTANGKADTGSL